MLVNHAGFSQFYGSGYCICSRSLRACNKHRFMQETWTCYDVCIKIKHHLLQSITQGCVDFSLLMESLICTYKFTIKKKQSIGCSTMLWKGCCKDEGTLYWRGSIAEWSDLVQTLLDCNGQQNGCACKSPILIICDMLNNSTVPFLLVLELITKIKYHICNAVVHKYCDIVLHLCDDTWCNSL